MKYPAWSIASVSGAVSTIRQPPAAGSSRGDNGVNERTRFVSEPAMTLRPFVNSSTPLTRWGPPARSGDGRYLFAGHPLPAKHREGRAADPEELATGFAPPDSTAYPSRR